MVHTSSGFPAYFSVSLYLLTQVVVMLLAGLFLTWAGTEGCLAPRAHGCNCHPSVGRGTGSRGEQLADTALLNFLSCRRDQREP